MRNLRNILFVSGLLTSGASALGAEPAIQVVNEAGLAPARLEAVLQDFRAYAKRVYAYTHFGGAPVTLRITRKVPFGFYEDETVLLPPSDDRQAMIEDWVHELTHHATGHDSGFFFKEGIATHVAEAVLAQTGHVPQSWPNFGRSANQWAALFARRGQLQSLAKMLDAPGYRGSSPEEDFRSWQVYLAGASFCGWYVKTRGWDEFRAAFDAQEFPGAVKALETAWRASLRDEKDFDASSALPQGNRRYRGYSERLRPP